jgi:sortase A
VAHRKEAIVRDRSQRIAALAFAVVGIACVAEASSIHAKAWLGQQLIAGAWRRVQRGEEAPRPWPWADTTPVARLEVPAHGVDLIVLAGGTGRTLAWGRDTHFAFLRDLSEEDEIYTEDRSGKRRVYRVKESFITHDRDAAVLAQGSESRLTLVTCWPFDSPLPGGPQRYVVVAEAL